MKWHTSIVWLVLLTVFVAWSGNAQPANLTSIGGFEGSLPSYWTKGNQPAGATLSWATDQFRSMGHSLKIVKPSDDSGLRCIVPETCATSGHRS